MLDPELQHYLSGINQNLTEIKTKKGPGIWRSFFNGVFSALGYFFGVAIVIVLLGWFLQRTGLLKPFQDQVKNFTSLVDAARKLLPSTDNTNTTSPAPQKASGGQATVTLPDGRQVQVNLPQ